MPLYTLLCIEKYRFTNQYELSRNVFIYKTAQRGMLTFRIYYGSSHIKQFCSLFIWLSNKRISITSQMFPQNSYIVFFYANKHNSDTLCGLWQYTNVKLNLWMFLYSFFYYVQLSTSNAIKNNRQAKIIP